MEQKLNIAEILKDKTENTKLYSRLFGDVYFYYVADDLIKVTHHDERVSVFFSDGRYYSYPESEPLLLPSKEMQDWSKFAWKKGDVLVSNDGKKRVFFNGFTDDTYALFKAKHGIEVFSDGHTLYFGDEDCIATSDYTLEDNEAAQTYIKTIEELLGRKLNLETLEVEKSQAEFKDGDILSCDEDSYTRHTTLIFHKNGDTRESIVSLVRHKKLIEDNNPINNFLLSRLYYAREDEKKELFDALAKEGKAWDAEKKVIVSLPKKCKFKAFDKVLCKDWDKGKWEADFFSHYNESSNYPFVCIKGVYKQCIPYNDMTRHLLCTTGEWKGDEG